MTNTIVANNLGSGTPSDVSGTITVANNNLIGTTTGVTITSGTANQLDVSAGLASSLAINGGITETLALLAGSNAIAKGGVLTSVASGHAVGVSDTTIYVTNAAAIARTAGNYLIWIDQEEILVTGVNTTSNTLTVQRGINGTTAASHSVGAGVYLAQDQRGVTTLIPPAIGAYESLDPIVTVVSPATGTAGGGTGVTITGANFSGVTAVQFGGINATSFTVNSVTQITATSPAGLGIEDVTVTTANGGTSSTSNVDHFTYPAIVTANTSTIADTSTAVTINGSGFSTTPTSDSVTFNLGVTGSVTSATSSQLTVSLTSPPTATGSLTAVVTVNGATSGVPVQVGTEAGGTWLVTNSAGTGGSLASVTLPYAVAHALSGDTITFAGSLSSSTITLSSGLTIGRNLTVTGLGASSLTVSGNNSVEDFLINSGVTASIASLAIANGSAARGGGINNQGTLTLTSDTISGNKASSSGGGIYSAGTLTISNSTVASNSALYGAGFGNNGVMTGIGSTFNANTASNTGGGVCNKNGNLTLSNSTVTNNSANTGAGVRNYTGTVTLSNDTIAYNTGIGVFNGGSTTDLLNTIVAGNTYGGSPLDVYGTIAVASYSLIANTSYLTITSGTSNQLGVSAGLAASLAGNGGSTQTLAVQSGSSAIGKGGSLTTVASGHAIGTSDTSIYVVNAAAIALTSGSYIIRIDSEQMLVTSVNTTTNILTVTRGVNGTTAATHSVGAGVYLAQDQRAISRFTPPSIGAYEYVVPSVTAVTPTSGAVGGGTSVTITGTYFTGATSVQFGSTTGSFTVNSPAQITATSPAGYGVVDVTVTTPSGGTSATSSADQFTYPVLVSVSTANVADSSTTLTINGSGFSTTAANNTITFNLGVVGTVTSATTSQLIVGLTSPPTALGSLTAVVTLNGVTSGSAVQVGTEVAGNWIVTSANGAGGSLSSVTLPYAVAHGENGDNIAFSGALSGATIRLNGTLNLTHNVTINAAAAGNVFITASPTLPSIPGLQYQLDASNPTSVVTSGSNVTQWTDLSGNGNNFAPATSGQDPILVQDAFDSLPALEFYPSGSGTPLVGADNVDAQTVFIVDAVLGTTTADEGIWGAYGVDISERLDVGSGGTKFLGNPNDGGNSNDYTNNGGGSTWVTEPSSFDQNTTTVGPLGTANILALTGNLTPLVTQIGGGSYTNRFFYGDIGEVLVYNTVLTTAQRQEVETYLSNKWLGTTLPGSYSEVFNISSGVTASISNLTILNGYGSDGGGISNHGTLSIANDSFSGNKASDSGGGIYNTGTLTVSNSTFSSNTALNGGGLANYGLATVTASVFNGNSATYSGGGGIFNVNGTITLSNSTLAYNSAPVGGAVRNYTGTVTLSNDTIAYNSATSGGGGVLNGGSTTDLFNTIVAGNLAGGSSNDVYGTIAIANYSLIGTTSDLTITSGTGNQLGVSAGLATNLANNGGSTQTLALQNGSNAIGKGGALTSVATGHAVAASDTTIYVGNAAAIAETSGSFLIRIDQEELLVTSVNISLNTLTVQRGVNGTTATTHAVGAGVYLFQDQRGITRRTASSIGAYDFPPPIVTGVNTNNGPGAGGTTVTITGANFSGATAVQFGSTNATSFTVNSATQITATAPAGSGVVDVTVTIPTGIVSPTSTADNYTYDVAPPSIAASWNPTTVTAGNSSTLSFTITNPTANTVSLTGVGFSDTLSTTMTIGSSYSGNIGGGNLTGFNGHVLTLSGASISAHSSIIFSVSVTPTNGGVFTDSESAVNSTNGGSGNTGSASLTVVAAPVLAISFSPTAIPLDGTSSLTFTITNPSANTVAETGVGIVEDVLPAGLTVVNGTSSEGGGTLTISGNNVITLSGATIGVGGQLTFSVSVTGASAGAYTDTTGLVFSGNGGFNNGASASITVIAPPSIAAAFNPATVALNGTSSLTFAITNPSANTVAETGVGFTDTLPAGLTVVNGTSSVGGGTLTISGGNTISLSNAAIAEGGQLQFSVTVTGTSGGSFTDSETAVTSTNGGTGNTASAQLTVVAPPSIATAFTSPFVSLNGTGTLTFTITNPTSNTVAETGVGFTDRLPAGLTLVNGTSNQGGGTLTLSGTNMITLSGASVAAGGTLTISVTVTGAAVGYYSDSESVVSSANGGNGNSASANVTVVAPPSISATFVSSPVAINGTSNLTFTITNPPANTVAETGVGFTDTLPAGLALAYGSSGVGGGTLEISGQTITMSMASIGMGGTLRFSVPVTGAIAGSYTDSESTVSSTNGGTGNTASASLTVENPPTLTAVFIPATVPLSGTSSLTFTITNPTGNTQTQNGVGFTDTLPPGLTATNVTSNVGGGTLTISDGTITLSGATIAIGSPLTFSVPVAWSSPGSYADKGGPVDISGNTASASLTVVAPPSIEAGFNVNTVALNGTSTLTFTIANPNATVAENGVGFTDVLPAGLTLVNGSSSQGGGTLTLSGGNTISLSGANINPGSELTFSVTVAAASAGSYTDNVGAVSSTNGGIGNTNSASLTVVVPPSLSAAFSPSLVLLDSSSTLSFTITNPSTTVSDTGVGFTDVLPAGLTLVNGTSSQGGGALTISGGNTIALSGASIAAGGTLAFSVAVTATTGGSYTDTTGSVSLSNGVLGNMATASIAVVSSPVSTTTTIVDNGLNPSLSGTAVNFTVVVNSAYPITGETVTIEDGSNGNAVVATPTLTNGTVTFTLSSLGTGTHKLFAVYQTDGTHAGSQSSAVTQTVQSTFGVNSVTTTPNGVVLLFNGPINPNTTVLYTSPGDTTYGTADITLTGATTGPIRGSLVIDAIKPNEATFVATSGVLPTDSYTLTVTTAVQAAGGAFLPANYTHTFSVTAPTTGVLSVPGFARGPGQSVALQNSPGIPVNISTVTNLTQASFNLTYDPTLLSIASTGALTLSAAASAAGLTISSYTIGGMDAHHSVLTVTVTGSGSGLTTIAVSQLLTITASVPSTAVYKDKAVLSLSSVQVNGAAGSGVSGVEVVAYLGDVLGTGLANATDASLVDQVGSGAGTGFSAFKDLDPSIIGGVDGGLLVNATDASLINEAASGASIAQIPAVPALPQGVTLTFGGPDPYLYLERGARCSRSDGDGNVVPGCNGSERYPVDSLG